MNKTEKNFKKLKDGKKYFKRLKKKEELPSFLVNISNQEFEKKAKPHRELVHSSPVFFGECKQLHPIFHPVNFGGHFVPLYTGSSEESVRSNLFIPEAITHRRYHTFNRIRRPKKKRHPCVDSKPHRSPGVRRIFYPDVTVFNPDLGQTTSVIEGETFREIPFRKIRSVASGMSSVASEEVMLSDIKEKKRDLLPYNQRMAHNHFPKEFVTVRLIGPVIPASLTITKMPSKRKRFSDYNFETRRRSLAARDADRKPRKSREYGLLTKASREGGSSKENRDSKRELRIERDRREMGSQEEDYDGDDEYWEEGGVGSEEFIIDGDEYEEDEEEFEMEQEDDEGEEEEVSMADEGKNAEGDKGE